MKYIENPFQKVTKKQCVEFGLSMVLVVASIGFYKKQYNYLGAVLVLGLIIIIIPILLYPFAVFWFGLSRILSAISSRVMLTIIFFIVVTPVGIVRRLTGSDSMKRKQFKKSSLSAMNARDHIYLPENLIHTF